MTFDDNGTKRDVAYRMSLAEMVVPSGSLGRPLPQDGLRHRGVGPGRDDDLALELGCDCLGEIVYVDATLANTRGGPTPSRTRSVWHEEDNAVLWKHVDYKHGAEVPAAPDGDLPCHATVANYDT